MVSFSDLGSGTSSLITGSKVFVVFHTAIIVQPAADTRLFASEIDRLIYQLDSRLRSIDNGLRTQRTLKNLTQSSPRKLR
jgi:hypothetical protein